MAKSGHGGRVRQLTVFAAALLTSAYASPHDGTETAREAGAASDATAASRLATDDVAYLTRLGLVRGHLRAALDLYSAGHRNHAREHLQHPGEELYAALGVAFADRGVEGFAGELDRLADLVRRDADDTAVDRAHATLADRIRAAESQVDPATARDAARQIAIVVNLLEKAAEEYGEGIVDGRVENVHEYQDAYGITQIALERAKAASSTLDDEAVREELARIASDIAALSNLWPTLVPGDRLEASAASITAVANTAARRFAQIHRRG